MVGFVAQSSSTMTSHDVQCYYGSMVHPAHEKLLTDDLTQTFYSAAQEPQSTAEMAQDMKNTDEAMAESAASSMRAGDDDYAD